MSFYYVIILFAFLIGLPSLGGAKSEFDGECEAGIIQNCSCALPIMKSRLSSADIGLLIRAWVDIQTQDTQRRGQFFIEQSANLLPVSLRYAEIKYVIAFNCGALAFDDE